MLAVLQYYWYRLSYRPNTKIFNPLLYSGRLGNLFILPVTYIGSPRYTERHQDVMAIMRNRVNQILQLHIIQNEKNLK